MEMKYFCTFQYPPTYPIQDCFTGSRWEWIVVSLRLFGLSTMRKFIPPDPAVGTEGKRVLLFSMTEEN
jgi:hypothetical protein